MTSKAVLQRGLQLRREHGDPAKLDFFAACSARRYLTLPWVLEARRLNMRAAHRRWLRRMGLPFHTRRAK